LYEIQSKLERSDRINYLGQENRALVDRIDRALGAEDESLRSIRAGLKDDSEFISSRRINTLLEKTRISMEDTRSQISKSIIENLEEVIRSNPDDPSVILRHIQTLLYQQKKYSSISSTSPAESALGRILESTLSPIGEYSEKSYQIAGGNYLLSDMIDYSRATMIRDSLEKNQRVMSIYDDVFDYLSQVRSTNVSAGEEFFSLSTLNRIFNYSDAKARVTSETKALKDIPRTMQQIPAEIIEALDSFGMGGISEVLSPSLFEPAASGKTINIGLMAAKNVENAYNPALDADFINDLLAMAAEKQEDVESIVAQRYRDRMTPVLNNKNITINADDMANATQRYITTLRQIIAIRRSRDSFENIKLRTPAMVEALETAVADSPVGSAVDSFDEILKQYTEEMANLASERAEAAQAYGDAVMTQIAPRTKYTRFGQFIQQQIADNPNLGRVLSGAFQNKGKIIAGAAAATGIAIFAMKRNKDVTPESISGPPLLPGGNPYENIPTMPYAIEPMPTAGGGQGVSYNVSVNGDYEKMQEFMSRAGYLSNGQMQGTMHSSLPDLGGNHYDDIAGSF
jgi:hypothetical protein